MRIAIYSRKSKWTGKGESIENQLLMCKEYIWNNFHDVKEEDIYEYEDEGFTGKNTQRPQFQRMMANLRKDHFDYLVCYKLDRLGRNLLDLVNLIDELNKMETSFISIKEKFDTSTPIGRAMMFFTGVLAQMEREQIAERVRDNMMMLARTGRWLGGTTPLGFCSEKDEAIAWNNKVKTSYRLIINENELNMVRFIFHEFLEKQSLSKIATYFLQNDIKTRNGHEYQISTIRDILTNPVYSVADMESYNYFEQLGCQVCIEQAYLDGIQGLISYGKTTSVRYKNKQNDPSEWIIAIAKHKGIITGSDFVKVQKILEMNKQKGDNFRKVQNQVSLLSGLLYCKCGAAMRPKYYPSSRLYANGNRTFAYICSHKEKSNSKQCNNSNVHGNILDQRICEEILSQSAVNCDVYQKLAKIRDSLDTEQNTSTNEMDMLQTVLNEKNSQINNLILSLSKSDGNEAFIKYVNQQITLLDKECKEVESKMQENTVANLSHDHFSGTNYTYEDIEDQLCSFQKSFEILSVLDKREYLRTIIEKIVWDGNTAHVYFYGSEQQ